MDMPETIKQISKIHSEVSSLYFSYEAACNRAEQAESELKVLSEEIEDAHNILTKLGVGKEHWSLGGRIHSLYIILNGLTPRQATDDPKLQP